MGSSLGHQAQHATKQQNQSEATQAIPSQKHIAQGHRHRGSTTTTTTTTTTLLGCPCNISRDAQGCFTDVLHGHAQGQPRQTGSVSRRSFGAVDVLLPPRQLRGRREACKCGKGSRLCHVYVVVRWRTLLYVIVRWCTSRVLSSNDFLDRLERERIGDGMDHQACQRGCAGTGGHAHQAAHE